MEDQVTSVIGWERVKILKIIIVIMMSRTWIRGQLRLEIQILDRWCMDSMIQAFQDPYYNVITKRQVVYFKLPPYIITSLICLLAKVLERIVHSRLHSMLDAWAECDNQLGFRQCRSTSSLLLIAVDDWARALNSFPVCF